MGMYGINKGYGVFKGFCPSKEFSDKYRTQIWMYQNLDMSMVELEEFEALIKYSYRLIDIRAQISKREREAAYMKHDEQVWFD